MIRLPDDPIRVLELRCADGPGGGPEKTILQGAVTSNPREVAVTVCYIRECGDGDPSIAGRAATLGVDYVELRQRNPLDLSLLTRLRQLVRARRIHIVHAHDYKTDLLALLLARQERIVPLATAHGWTGHSRRERWVYYPSDKRLLARFPSVLAVSSQIRDELVRCGARPSRVEVLLNGIDHERYRRDVFRVLGARARFGIGSDVVAIGAVGRVEPQKRFDLLINAVARLYPRYPELRLLIAGEGSLRPSLHSQIRNLGLENVCRLIGHCQEIRDFYHAVDVFVQSSDYEGTPNVVLEAMALEVPVVATDVGGTAELISQGTHGLIVPRRDATALSDAIAQVLADGHGSRRRVAAARYRIETELSFECRCRTLHRVYMELIRNQSKSPIALSLRKQVTSMVRG